jgi:hypothetical protein
MIKKLKNGKVPTKGRRIIDRQIDGLKEILDKQQIDWRETIKLSRGENIH